MLEAGLISENKLKKIESGHLAEADAETELSQWLHGTSPIAGLLIIQTGEKMSLYSAAKRGFLRRGTAISSELKILQKKLRNFRIYGMIYEGISDLI